MDATEPAKKPSLTPEQQALVTQFLPLAHKFVNRNLHNSAVAADTDEAFQFACLTLCRAARSFDPAKGVKPITYFWRSLAAEFSRYSAGTLVHVPAGHLDERPKIDLRDPHCFDNLPDRESEERTTEERTNNSVADCLALLPAREADVLARRFGLGGKPKEELAQIAAELGISKQRVSQIKDRALARLRELHGWRLRKR